MRINNYSLIEGAEMAEGLTVIIDVFRAFSTACYLFAAGVEKIIPVASRKEAEALKNSNSDFILCGERGGKKLTGFDYGNSPTFLKDQDFNKKTIVFSTSAGTKGIVAAKKAERIITGSFVNFSAVINYIKKIQPEMVSLVAMGIGGQKAAREDELCAELMKKELKGNDLLHNYDLKRKLATAGNRFFLSENQNFSPRKDFSLCLQVNRFDFVIKAVQKDRNYHLLKI